jgi:hypothetical protein
MQQYQKDFVDFMLEIGALKFGEFTLKSGRISPYFFNAGAFKKLRRKKTSWMNDFIQKNTIAITKVPKKRAILAQQFLANKRPLKSLKRARGMILILKDDSCGKQPEFF